MTFILRPNGVQEDTEKEAKEGGIEFYGHRAILATRNPYFRSLFHYWKEEGNPKAGKIPHEKIILRKVDPDVFQVLLEYLYVYFLIFSYLLTNLS